MLLRIEPFLKWAGGKRWLWRDHNARFPRTFNRYCEPFLGAGAVFLNIQPLRGILSDANPELINVYIQIRDHWRAVRNRLKEHQANHSEDYYYQTRASIPTAPIDRAGRFLYLNRTCWNGLFRVNLKGEFNVPIGTKTKVLLESDDFSSVSKLLRPLELRACDFEATLQRIGAGDLAYVDPPYTVNHNANGFLKYNEKIFSWQDQIRLANAVRAAGEAGAMVVVSQADHQTIRDLYSDFGKVRVVHRPSVIAASASRRGPTSELLISINC